MFTLLYLIISLKSSQGRHLNPPRLCKHSFMNTDLGGKITLIYESSLISERIKGFTVLEVGFVLGTSYK